MCAQKELCTTLVKAIRCVTALSATRDVHNRIHITRSLPTRHSQQKPQHVCRSKVRHSPTHGGAQGPWLEYLRFGKLSQSVRDTDWARPPRPMPLLPPLRHVRDEVTHSTLARRRGHTCSSPRSHVLSLRSLMPAAET